MRVLEIASQRNIVLFHVDPQSPNGGFLFEKSHGVFNDYPEKFEKTMMILRNYSPESRSHQCEILVRYNKTNQYEFDFDTSDGIVEKVTKYKHLAYRTYKI